MATEITMPQLSDTMDEGTILTWLKKEGDQVSRGDALAEVSTDKADLEIESFHEGTLLKVLAKEGETIKVGSLIAYVGEKGEEVPDAATEKKSAASEEKEEEQDKEQEQEQERKAEQAKEEKVEVAPTPEPTRAPSSTNGSGERVKISPVAKNLADSYSVDYSEIAGTGEGGRITKRDVEQVVHGGSMTPTQVARQPEKQVRNIPPAAQEPKVPASARRAVMPSVAGSSKELSKMRTTIANRMVESKNTIPHYYVTTKVRMDRVIETRKSLKLLPQYEGVTFNHFIVRAAALALRDVPVVNAHVEENKLVYPEGINIGIITAVEDGLLIPVLKHADKMAFADIVFEARGLVQRARAGRPTAEDLRGGTFSISNMGTFSVESFTAIVNPGQGAILAISAIDKEPVLVDGELAVGSVMRATLSVDHRIIDGTVAGDFLTQLKQYLEDPVLLLA